jgi:two-component system, cell cycle sensor histidine kinase and response regulator CckA
VDRSQFELMIINLVLNARDAMPEGGTLSITTREEVLESERIPDAGGHSRYAVLHVRDTGHGMTPDISARIFEPFFTTKEQGKGTGLGLSTAYGIVEQVGGHITVESEPDQGTTFRVYFPLAALAAEADEAVALPLPGRGTETILLVEDEEGIRTMTAAYLQSLGYNILEANDGSAAARVSREYQGNIHLLLTDILMPGIRGDDLSRLLSRERPGMLTIFMSGYANVHDRDPQIPVLEKPFSFPELGQQVRLTLNAAMASPQKPEHAA